VLRSYALLWTVYGRLTSRVQVTRRRRCLEYGIRRFRYVHAFACKRLVWWCSSQDGLDMYIYSTCSSVLNGSFPQLSKEQRTSCSTWARILLYDVYLLKQSQLRSVKNGSLLFLLSYCILRNTYSILVRTFEGRRLFGRPRRRWENNIWIKFKQRSVGLWVHMDSLIYMKLKLRSKTFVAQKFCAVTMSITEFTCLWSVVSLLPAFFILEQKL
jgi:hypothetical protein